MSKFSRLIDSDMLHSLRSATQPCGDIAHDAAMGENQDAAIHPSLAAAQQRLAQARSAAVSRGVEAGILPPPAQELHVTHVGSGQVALGQLASPSTPATIGAAHNTTRHL